MLFLLFSSQSAYADERSFQIDEVEIYARIDAAGHMHVQEKDRYRFEGAFNGIIVELDSSKSDGIVDFQAFEVSEDRQTSLQTEFTSNGNRLEYRVYSQSQDESKDFLLTYTVKNVVQVYADTAELYWKFFDSRNPSTMGTVTIDVELPGGIAGEEITAFGHGPSHGHVGIEEGGMVRYEISPLSAGELLEVRVLFPGDYVPGSMRVSDVAMLEAILEEERRWAEGDIRTLYVALALLLLNLAGGIYLKYGSAFKSAGWKGKYYRELPADITPAVVGYLKYYKVKPRDLMATMVDLVRKQHVHMVVNKKAGIGRRKTDYTFQLLHGREDQLHPHEALLIQWFFREIGKEGEVSLSGIRKYTKKRKHAESFRKSWSQWQDEVAQAATSAGYIASQKWLRRMVQFAAVAQFFGLWFLAPENWNWLMFCAVPLVFLIPKKQRRTKSGRLEYAKWEAFRRFLRDYSQIASREPMAVHLWAHYFVYAIPLGVAKKMIAITRLEVPGAEEPWIDSTYFDHHMLWTASFKQSVNVATVSVSSSSGGSFSSGGGGGGGGGGRGAF